MSNREQHPTWIRPKSREIEGILGDCLASPIQEIQVTVEEKTFNDPRIEALMNCSRYPNNSHHKIDRPFPLADAADTNTEQLQLGIDSVKIALNSICKTCPFKSTVG